MAKPYTVKKEFDGVMYTFQFNGITAAMEALDESYIDGSSNISLKKLNKYLLENVVVDPKVTMDDFEDVEKLNAVTAFARKVMQGIIKPEDSAAKK